MLSPGYSISSSSHPKTKTNQLYPRMALTPHTTNPAATMLPTGMLIVSITQTLYTTLIYGSTSTVSQWTTIHVSTTSSLPTISTSLPPHSGTASPTAFPSTLTPTIYTAPAPWTYTGCYNETTLLDGKRALEGGVLQDTTNMTVPLCLSYCAVSGFTWAGLEYTRFVPLLSSFFSPLIPLSSSKGYHKHHTQIDARQQQRMLLCPIPLATLLPPSH